MSMESKAPEEAVAGIERGLRYIDGILKQKGREMLSEYGITPPQFIALHSLYEKGDTTIGDLSARMFLACSTTTDLVDRMEKAALVARVKDQKDRRIVRIHLLPEGEQLIKELMDKRCRYIGSVVDCFSKEEAEQLTTLLTKMYTEMKAN